MYITMWPPFWRRVGKHDNYIYGFPTNNSESITIAAALLAGLVQALKVLKNLKVKIQKKTYLNVRIIVLDFSSAFPVF